MKIRPIYFFLFGWTCGLLGQQSTPSPSAAPLPSGPLLKRMPEYSTWRVTCEGLPVAGDAPRAKESTADGQGKAKDALVIQSSVVKTGSTIFEEEVDAHGQHMQVWHVSGLRITMDPGARTPTVCPDYGGGDIYSVNFTAADFAGLDWVSAETYSGVTKYQGRDCMIFKSNVSPLEGLAQKLEAAAIEQARALGHHVANAVRVPVVAYIDLDTRLPIYAEFGKQKRNYQYGTPLTAPIVLPTQVADPAKDYEQRLHKLSAPASRPF